MGEGLRQKRTSSVCVCMRDRERLRESRARTVCSNARAPFDAPQRAWTRTAPRRWPRAPVPFDGAPGRAKRRLRYIARRSSARRHASIHERCPRRRDGSCTHSM